MPSRLPRPSGKEMVRFLMRQDFTLVRSRSSHHFLARGHLRTSVPVHGNRPLKIGTLLSILRDVQMSPVEFGDLWRS